MFLNFAVFTKLAITRRTILVVTVIIGNQINPITNLTFNRRHITRNNANIRRLIMLNAAFNIKTTIHTQILLFRARVLTSNARIKTIRRFDANKSNQVPVRFSRANAAASTRFITKIDALTTRLILRTRLNRTINRMTRNLIIVRINLRSPTLQLSTARLRRRFTVTRFTTLSHRLGHATTLIDTAQATTLNLR